MDQKSILTRQKDLLNLLNDPLLNSPNKSLGPKELSIRLNVSKGTVYNDLRRLGIKLNLIEPRENHIGNTFGRLKVLSVAAKNSNGELIWRCECECGNYKDINANNIIKGLTRSCGCLYLETRPFTNKDKKRSFESKMRISKAKAIQFTKEEILTIKDHYFRQTKSISEIARLYMVSGPVISKIINDTNIYQEKVTYTNDKVERDSVFLPELFKKFRRDIGWSQFEMGEKLGVTKQAISAWEKSRKIPNVHHAQILRLYDEIYQCY